MPRQRRFSDNVNLLSVFSNSSTAHEEAIDVEEYTQERSSVVETKKRKGVVTVCTPTETPTISNTVDVDSMGPVSSSNVRVAVSNRSFGNAYPIQRHSNTPRTPATFSTASPLGKDAQIQRSAAAHLQQRSAQNGLQLDDMDAARRPILARRRAIAQDMSSASASTAAGMTLDDALRGGFTPHLTPLDRYKVVEEEDLDVVNAEDIFSVSGQAFFNAESFLRAVSTTVYSTEEFEESLEQLIGREPPAADIMDIITAYRTLRAQNTVYANVIKVLLGHTMTLNARVTLLEAESARDQDALAMLRAKVDEVSQYNIQRLYKDTMFDVSRLNALGTFIIEAEPPLRTVDAVTVFEAICILFGVERIPMTTEEQQLRDDFVRKFIKDVKKELGNFRRKRRAIDDEAATV
ncbi:unnamed protein product [Toxocara canis]|uniref:WAPL domain-containing protein n=1 Tax=Toxocara canis TaxID=6265 RepID=A0A183UT17_TOXCA|nr:unnamed protein product [Toxocara canis]